MSRLTVISTGENSGRIEHSFPVSIKQTIAKEIDAIATERQMKVEVLVNEILEQYIANQHNIKKQSGTDFLLSLAGMFNSGANDVSENTHTIITDFILNKYGEKSS